MRTDTLSRLLLTGLLMASSTLPLASNVALADTELAGSALPPGINPTSPAGGNGGDAQGYDKKPVAPPAAGTEKAKTNSKAAQPASTNKKAATPTSERKHAAPQKTRTVKKP